MNEHAAVLTLAALAQEARLKIFRTLIGAAHPGLTPGELSATLGIPASTMSFHLKELAQAGLVSVVRESRHLIYRPSVQHMNELIAYLTDHCCEGQDCGLTSKKAAPLFCE